MTTQLEDLIDVLKRVNKKQEKPANEKTLMQIIALVVKHPLDDDRATCQQQIVEIISQRIGE